MKSNLTSTAPMLTPGRYWITDPCYAYPDKEWDKFCDEYWKRHTGFYEYGAHQFFVFGTAYGDGVYDLTGPTPGQLGVDAGLLSIIPDALVKKWKSVKEMKRLMKNGLVALIELSEDADVIEKDGNVKFGPYSIVTDGSDFPDDDDDESWD